MLKFYQKKSKKQVFLKENVIIRCMKFLKTVTIILLFMAITNSAFAISDIAL